MTLTLEQGIMDAPRSVGRSRLSRRLAFGGTEESPHSVERDAGQLPERGNLLDRATETNCQVTGKGETAV